MKETIISLIYIHLHITAEVHHFQSQARDDTQSFVVCSLTIRNVSGTSEMKYKKRLQTFANKERKKKRHTESNLSCMVLIEYHLHRKGSPINTHSACTVENVNKLEKL